MTRGMWLPGPKGLLWHGEDGRPIEEWVGKTPMSRIPRETKLRILARFDDGCADCTRLFGPRLKPQFDHRPPLHNGGENRESKIEPLCGECHRLRTDQDTVKRAAVKRYRAAVYGLKPPTKHPVPGSKRSKWKKQYNRETGRFEPVLREPQEKENGNGST